jgi:hypothetical protein
VSIESFIVAVRRLLAGRRRAPSHPEPRADRDEPGRTMPRPADVPSPLHSAVAITPLTASTETPDAADLAHLEATHEAITARREFYAPEREDESLERGSTSETELSALSETTYSEDDVAEVLTDEALLALGIGAPPPGPPTPEFVPDEDVYVQAEALEERPTRDDLTQEVQRGGRLTRAERALQVAVEVGRPYGWERDGIDLLAQTFERYWWSSARRSIERELAAGMTVGELALALDVRQLWTERPEFSIDFGPVIRWHAWYRARSETRPSYRTLGWPTTLAVVRTVGEGASIDEVACFLDELYEHWYETDHLHYEFNAFESYVAYRTGRYHSTLQGYPGWTFEENGAGDDEDGDSEDSHETGFTTRRYKQLEALGLLPQGPCGAMPSRLRPGEVEPSDGD